MRWRWMSVIKNDFVVVTMRGRIFEVEEKKGGGGGRRLEEWAGARMWHDVIDGN